eukprot:symbB.v1.2.030183.t1/scaffold3354.1/size58575/4
MVETDEASCRTFAKHLRKVIHLPLEYDVFPEDEVLPPVFASTSKTSEQVGRLPEGTIQGYPAGEWLHVSGQEVARLKGQGLLDGDFEDGWVCLEQSVSPAEGPRVLPRWAQIEIELVFLEALEFSWSGIAGEFVTYTVQWRKSEHSDGDEHSGEHVTDVEEPAEPTDENSSPVDCEQDCPQDTIKKSGAIECTSTRGLIHGLPQASTIEVRVIAAVTGPEIDFNELEIVGSWTQLCTGSPSPDEDALGDRDLLGGYRGGCLVSLCRGYLAAPLQSPHPERCRRCGNSYEEHLELEDQAPKDIAENNEAADAGGAKASQESSRIEEDTGDPDDLDDPDNADDANDADDADDAADAGGAKASQESSRIEEDTGDPDDLDDPDNADDANDADDADDAADAGGAKASQESSRIEEDMGDPDDLDDPDNADDANDADDADDAADAGGAKASQDAQHYEEVAKDCRSVLSEPLVFSVGEMQAPLRDIPRADASIVPPALFSFAGCFALGKDYRAILLTTGSKSSQLLNTQKSQPDGFSLPPALPLLQLVGFVAGGQMFRGYPGRIAIISMRGVKLTLQLAPTVRYFSVEICKSADLPPFWAQKLVYSRILSSMTNQTAAAGMGEVIPTSSTEEGRSPLQFHDQRSSKSQWSVSSDPDRRFKDLLEQLMEEHTVIVSDLNEANQRLRSEILELQPGPPNSWSTLRPCSPCSPKMSVKMI